MTENKDKIIAKLRAKIQQLSDRVDAELARNEDLEAKLEDALRRLEVCYARLCEEAGNDQRAARERTWQAIQRAQYVEVS